MSSELTKVGVQPDDEDYVQWMVDHPEEDHEEDYDEQYESGYDADLKSYVSKQLLNGYHTIDIENNTSNFVKYEGEFVSGKREGQGVYYQMDIFEGQIDFEYEGEFKDNLPNGEGFVSWVEHGHIYTAIEGNFVNGLPDSTQPCTVTIEYIPEETSISPATKKTMTVMVKHVSSKKPSSDEPNNLLDVYWQGVFELSGMMSDETGSEVIGVFDIHGNVLSQKAGRRSRKSINKKKKYSQKKRI
jgi:hypothetical protein